MIASIVAGILTNAFTEAVVGRIVPEITNVGRRIAARERGGRFVALQEEVPTAKGWRTTVFALILVVLKLAEWTGFWTPPADLYDVLAGLMTGSLALKAVR